MYLFVPQERNDSKNGKKKEDIKKVEKMHQN